MTIELSIAARNRLIDVQAAAFGDGTLSLYTGPAPASVEDEPTGTLIVAIRLPLSAWGDAAAGTAQLAGQWYMTSQVTGAAAWFRLADSTGTRWLDGTISGPGGGGDLILDDVTVTGGDLVQILSFPLALVP